MNNILYLIKQILKVNWNLEIFEIDWEPEKTNLTRVPIPMLKECTYAILKIF